MKKKKMSHRKMKKILTEEEKLKVAIGNFREAAENYKLMADPKTIEQLAGETIVKCMFGDAKPEDVNDEVQEYANKYFNAKNLDTNSLLWSCVGDGLAGVVVDTVRRLQEEYKVTTPQDKAYLQIAAVAYCRFITNTRWLERYSDFEYLGAERVALFNMLSKDADRSFRQYDTIIQRMELRRAQPINLKINAHNAYLAHNQQNLSTNEIINEQQSFRKKSVNGPVSEDQIEGLPKESKEGPEEVLS